MEFNLDIAAMTQWTKAVGIPVLLIILGLIVLVKVANIAIDKYFKELTKASLDDEIEKRNKTLRHIIKSIVDITVVVIGALLVLSKLGIDITPILAAAGVLGLAVGFGAQRFIEDLITGAIILIEDQIRIGDCVKIGDKSGMVERVDLKTTVLRDFSGNVHYIRNGKIDIVTNMTKDFSMYVFDIGVAYKENAEEVIEVIKQVGEDLRNNTEIGKKMMEPIEVLGIDKFDDSAVVIKARAKTKPFEQWNVARAFNLKLKKRFDELNIEIPFPHTTLYVGQEKDGSSPALNVNINK